MVGKNSSSSSKGYDSSACYTGYTDGRNQKINKAIS